MITLGVRIVAVGADSGDVPVCEEEVAVLAKGLLEALFSNEAIAAEVKEDILGDLRMDGRAGPAEVVEGDVEPLIDLPVDLVILVTNRLRSRLL